MQENNIENKDLYALSCQYLQLVRAARASWWPQVESEQNKHYMNEYLFLYP